MEVNIQVTVMDSRRFILEYKNFPITDYPGVVDYVYEIMRKPMSKIIEIRKWNDRVERQSED
jgi:hypothetical protein